MTAKTWDSYLATFTLYVYLILDCVLSVSLHFNHTRWQRERGKNNAYTALLWLSSYNIFSCCFLFLLHRLHIFVCGAKIKSIFEDWKHDSVHFFSSLGSSFTVYKQRMYNISQHYDFILFSTCQNVCILRAMNSIWKNWSKSHNSSSNNDEEI